MSRYYDPVTHRYINADGYFQSGGDLLDTNMSAYCGNNPVNYSDPTGQYKVCPIHGDSYSQPNCVYCHPEYKLSGPVIKVRKRRTKNAGKWQRGGNDRLFSVPKLWRGKVSKWKETNGWKPETTGSKG